MDNHDEEKRTEFNLIVRSRKSEAELVLDVLYCWTYWQTRSLARHVCDSRLLVLYVCGSAFGSNDQRNKQQSNGVYFYCATRMHSADYAVARCLLVCLSVTRRYSVDTADHILKDFLLSFFVPNITTIFFRRGPSNGASNTRKCEEIAIFDQYLALSPKRCKLES